MTTETIVEIITSPSEVAVASSEVVVEIGPISGPPGPASGSGPGGGVELGETSTTAYRGDRGKIAYDHSQTTGNPHGATAAQVGADPAGTAAGLVATEATTRAAADVALDGRLDVIEAVSIATDAELAAAVAAEATARNTAISAAIAALVASAPGVLDTLDEIAAALGDDANFAATMTTALAGKQPLDSDLTAIAALSTTSYGRAFLALADATAGRSALGLGTAATTAATAYDPAGSAAAAQAASQPLDSDLTAIAALTTSSFGRSLLEAANAGALRTLAGLVIDTDVLAPNGSGASLTALNGSQVTTGTVAEARIDSTIARDSEVSAAVAAEATLARDGANLTAATVPVSKLNATGTPSSSTYLRGDGSWNTPAGGGAAFNPEDFWHPTGAKAGTFPRYVVTTGSTFLTSGRLGFVACPLDIGVTVTSISFISAGTAASVPTNQWFGLFDSTGAALRLTADNTTTAWSGNSVKTLTLTTPFVTTYAGLHYLGIMVAATTPPNLHCAVAGGTAVIGLAPAAAGGTAATGLTTPPALPYSPGLVTTPTVGVPYAYVS